MGPGAAVLLQRAGLNGDRAALAMTAEELALLAQAFAEWPDRPAIEDTDVELPSRW